jgi:cytochrome c
VLNGIMGQPMGAVEGFKYSKVMSEAGVEGRVWDDASMTEFLTKPRDYMKGTKMSFNGFKDIADTEAVIAYLHSLSQ